MLWPGKLGGDELSRSRPTSRSDLSNSRLMPRFVFILFSYAFFIGQARGPFLQNILTEHMSVRRDSCRSQCPILRRSRYSSLLVLAEIHPRDSSNVIPTNIDTGISGNPKIYVIKYWRRKGGSGDLDPAHGNLRFSTSKHS